MIIGICKRVTTLKFWGRLLCEIGLVIISLIFLYPMALVYINALKPYGEIVVSLTSLPSHPTLENIQRVLETSNYVVAVMNSVMYVAIFIPIVAILSCMAGYMIGRTNDRKSKMILSLFMVSMAVPFTSVMLPLFKILGRLGLVNTRLGYAVVSIPLLCPAYVFFYSAYVANIPREIEEAAIIDGCGLIRCFASVVFPLCKTMTVTVSVLLFLAVWNDYLLPSLIFRDMGLRTVTLMLQKYQGEYGTKWDMMMGCAALVMTPSLVIYVFSQRFIINGMIAGAIKA